MAGLLSFPSQAVGLMGRTRNQQLPPELLAWMQGQQVPQGPIMADAADEAMYARNAGGTPALQAEGAAILAAQQPDMTGRVSYDRLPAGVQAAPNTAIASPAAPAARNRVSGWRVLDRVLGGQTVSEGLDTERARLQAEADRPQALAQQQRLAAALGQLPLPLQIAYQSNPEEVGKALASNYEGYTLGAGGLRGGLGGVMSSAPTFSTVNDEIRRNDPGTGQSSIAGVAAPSFADQTARINANNPVNVAQNATLVDPRTGATVAQGLVRPDLTSVAPGGQIYATDETGNTRLVGESTAQRPLSDSDQRAVAEAESNLARLDNTVARAQGILGSIRGGSLNLSPVGNLIGGIRNATGSSNENSLALADLKNWAESARNEILQSATGPQTEGDALRALGVILSGTNDERIVQQALQRYIDEKQRIRPVYERDIQRRQGGQAQPQQQRSGPVTITNDAEYAALPSGTEFVAPDGSRRRKP